MPGKIIRQDVWNESSWHSHLANTRFIYCFQSLNVHLAAVITPISWEGVLAERIPPISCSTSNSEVTKGDTLSYLCKSLSWNTELSSCNSSFLTARSGMLNAILFFCHVINGCLLQWCHLVFQTCNKLIHHFKIVLFFFSKSYLCLQNDIFDVYPVVTVTIKLFEGFVYLKTLVAFLTAHLSNATIFTGSSFFWLPKTSWCC